MMRRRFARSASVSLRAARLTAPMGLSAAAAAARISKSQLDRDLVSGTARGRCAQAALTAASDVRRNRRAAAASVVWCPPPAAADAPQQTRPAVSGIGCRAALRR